MTKVLMETAREICDTIMSEFGSSINKKWQYDAGLMLKGFERVYEECKDKRYRDYIDVYFDRFIKEDGSIETYDPNVRNIDHINCGKNLFYLYEKTGQERYAKAIELLASQFAIQPRTPSGAYWHKQIYPNQVWLDGIFMGEPFAAEYARKFGHPEKYEDILCQFETAERLTYSPRCGLYVHGCDESKQAFWADKNTGQSLNVWGRSCGWFCMALVDTLDFVPEDSPVFEKLHAMLKKVMANVIKYQDESGVWYQVMDNRRSDNYQESTCTCMFAYTMEKGIRKGLLDGEIYAAPLKKAVDGIMNVFVEKRGSGTYITKGCAVAGLGPEDNPRRNGTLDYYFSESVRDNDFKGVGPFLIMAATYEE